jgi:hypothetical protein
VADIPVGSVVIDAGKLIVTTSNHGGYLGADCVYCGVTGWRDRLQHKPDCPVPAALEAKNANEG